MTASGSDRAATWLLAALLLLAPSGPVIAQDADESEEVETGRSWDSFDETTDPDAYVQGGLVQAFDRFKAPADGMGVGFDLTVGARLNRFIAAEAGFEGVYTWVLRGVDTSTYAFMLSGKSLAPISGFGPIRSIQPFALVGMGVLLEQQNRRMVSRFAYRFGGGVDVYLSETFYLSLIYRYTGNLDTFGYTNLVYGIGYRFY